MTIDSTPACLPRPSGSPSFSTPQRGPGGTFTGVSGSPEYVREAAEASLNHLGVETIDLYYQLRVDPNTLEFEYLEKIQANSTGTSPSESTHLTTSPLQIAIGCLPHVQVPELRSSLLCVQTPTAAVILPSSFQPFFASPSSFHPFFATVSRSFLSSEPEGLGTSMLIYLAKRSASLTPKWPLPLSSTLPAALPSWSGPRFSSSAASIPLSNSTPLEDPRAAAFRVLKATFGHEDREVALLPNSSFGVEEDRRRDAFQSFTLPPNKAKSSAKRDKSFMYCGLALPSRLGHPTLPATSGTLRLCYNPRPTEPSRFALARPALQPPQLPIEALRRGGWDLTISRNSGPCSDFFWVFSVDFIVLDSPSVMPGIGQSAEGIKSSNQCARYLGRLKRTAPDVVVIKVASCQSGCPLEALSLANFVQDYDPFCAEQTPSETQMFCSLGSSYSSQILEDGTDPRLP
ncbi:hypothetical protein BDK51DRAFT_48045, partial [Blyttiomyces helicus]